MQQFHFNEASIYIYEGNLIVNVQSLKYDRLYRNVNCTIENGILTVTGNFIEFIQFHNDTNPYHYPFVTYNHELFHTVKPEYLETVKVTRKKWFKKKVTEELRIKEGWCELLLDPKPETFITSRFIIKT